MNTEQPNATLAGKILPVTGHLFKFVNSSMSKTHRCFLCGSRQREEPGNKLFYCCVENKKAAVDVKIMLVKDVKHIRHIIVLSPVPGKPGLQIATCTKHQNVMERIIEVTNKHQNMINEELVQRARLLAFDSIY